jgi:hypothetical protein
MNGLQYNYFRTFQQIKRYSGLTFFKTCLQLVLVGALVLAGYGIFGAAVGLFVTDLVLFLIMGILIVSEIGVASRDSGTCGSTSPLASPRCRETSPAGW